MNTLRHTTLLVLAASLFVAGGVGGQQVGSAQGSATRMAIVGGTVIDGTGAPARPNTNIIITGDRITRIGPAASTPAPAGAQAINAAGKYVIPGLWESHVHYRDFQTELLITHGITSAIDWTDPPEKEWAFLQKEGQAKGKIRGPRLFIAGETIRPGATPEQARAQVRELKARGADTVNVVFNTRKDTLVAAIDEAKKVGLPSAGYPVYTKTAIEAGINAIKHTYVLGSASVPDEDTFAQQQMKIDNLAARDARKFLLADNYQELAKLMAAKKVAWVPTFTKDFKVMLDQRDQFELEAYRLLANPELQYLPSHNYLLMLTNAHATGIGLVASGRIGTVDRTGADWEVWRKAYKNLLGFMKYFTDQGGRMLAGTAPHSFVLPGLSIHQEMQVFVDAGLTPMQALQTATIYPAEYARKDKDLGSITEGKLADIVVLKQNPLENIRHSRTIDTVIQGGKVLPIGYHRNYVNPIPRVAQAGAGTASEGGPPGEGYALPILTAVSPTTITEGSNDATITVRGRGFVPVSVVYFERMPLQTSFVSGTELKAVVPAGLAAKVGTYLVRVWTPRPGGGNSVDLPFFVQFR